MSRQIALEKELEQIKQINQVVGKVVSTVKKAHTDIIKSNESIENTNKLVNKWIDILSQSDYTKHRIQNYYQDDDVVQEKLQKEQEMMKELERLKKENEELTRKLK
ncbi:hypothetical protein CLIB1444_07S01178 [[Candida] jaroonii]|uniref:Uncharacterized protein n=1 Tax=[Candida] jaroonii TaxID=467808 RepID=A0ACA9Y9J9_9ASCO|nr:hypothetical protein CLIB1444_07S01178 [[Candida] jaroonii]